MNPSDKLQLIRALEEGEAAHRRRSNWLAWSSVLVAAVILGAMIWAGRRELMEIERRVDATRDELRRAQDDLKKANDNLSNVKAQTDEALRNLQNVDGRAGGAYAIENAVDNLLAASSAALPPPPSGGPADSSRTQLIEQLFDPNASVRVRAYSGLLPRYKDDPTLVPEVLKVAQENPQNANGIYNALVVLSHMNATSLRPHSKEIAAFAAASQSVGPRVSERARTLLSRLPK
jgi:hypothetical protein